ncbi:MAG: hypothetical protein HKN07_04040 [Acidimicrobiia bacterium]|nr:hypothetical protein [Acidimicrobiia bacterium]
MTANTVDLSPDDNSVVTLEVADEVVAPEKVKSPKGNSAKTSSAPVPAPKRGFFRRLWKAVKVLLGLALVALVAGAIYLGIPELNDRVLNPLSDNTARLSAVTDDVAASEATLAELDTAIVGLDARVAELAAAEAVVPDRLLSLENGLADVVETQAQFDDRMASIESAIAGHTRQIDTLDELQATLSADVAAGSAELATQVTTLQVMELLSRARLFLYQANYGLAEQDVVAARALIDTDTAAGEEVALRLDRVIDGLPERPVTAADDLDIAWQLLLSPSVVSGE